ncbi:Arginine--tRNA ligase [subsurface metagenome]
MNRKSLARQVVWDAILKKKDYGQSKIGKGKKVVVEFSSPNIARSFGIGHLRSTIIGNSLANIFEFQGYKVIRINYLGDWGTQFGRLILGYKKFGNEKKLEKDPIKHLMEIYVKVNKKQYEKGARKEFKKLEEGDRKSLMLWKLFKGMSLEEFEKIYKLFGIKFDSIEGESHYNKKTEKIVEELKEKGLLKKSKGAQIVNLKKYGLDISLIKKSDGATLYATRDLAAAVSRYKKHKFEKMIYEVGQEQRLYFKQLFKILELIGYDWAKNCEHVYHVALS